MTTPLLGGPLWAMIATGLGRIDGRSPIEAAVLANLIRNAGDYASSDPHCVIAAAVADIVRGQEPNRIDVDAVRAAFADLDVEVLR